MSRATPSHPDWDALIYADQADLDAHGWFPCGKTKTAKNLPALEGLRCRNIYVTSRAIEEGSFELFFHLYFNARITGGKVLHVTDFRESE
ncbi:MAG: hypothetical protein ACXVYB_00385 [Arthrobacter sp.]